MSDQIKPQRDVVDLVTVKANEHQNEGNLPQITEEISENPELHQPLFSCLCLLTYTVMQNKSNTCFYRAETLSLWCQIKASFKASVQSELRSLLSQFPKVKRQMHLGEPKRNAHRYQCSLGWAVGNFNQIWQRGRCLKGTKLLPIFESF